MRPVDKGDCPQKDGKNIVFKEYTQARGELIKRLGEYCSFCEMHLDAGLHVEHRLPKSVARYAHLECEWTNFLLACVNCNSTKGDRDIEADDYLWADRDNTAFALEYSEGGLLKPRQGLSGEEARKAQNLIALVGLDKKAGNTFTVSDRRWLNRREKWEIAQRTRRNLACSDTLHHRETIVAMALDSGYFSVWMTVFAEDADMLCRILAAYPGTARDCVNPMGQCIEQIARTE